MPRTRISIGDLKVDSFETTQSFEAVQAVDKQNSCTGHLCSLCCVEPTCTDCHLCR